MLALLARLPRSFVTRRALGWLVAALVATVGWKVHGVKLLAPCAIAGLAWRLVA